MPKEEWGTKRLCPHCSTRFYDLQNDPMTCPACGAQFSVESLQGGRSRNIASEKASANKDDKDVDVIDDTDLDDDTDAGDLDDDLLDDDDDDNVSLDEIADVSKDDDE